MRHPSPCSCLRHVLQCKVQNDSLIAATLQSLQLLKRHNTSESLYGPSRRCIAATRAWTCALKTRTSDLGGGIIVVKSSRLEKIHGDSEVDLHESPSNHRSSDQGNKDHEDDEVEDGVADDSSLSQLGLLQ